MLAPLGLHDRSRTFWLSALAGTALTIGLLSWLAIAWLNRPQTPRITANNISRNFRACLITDQQDNDTSQIAWAGIQDAARATPVNAQRITIPKTTSSSVQIPYINSAVQRNCGLIISIGTSLHAALETTAQHNPHQQFINAGQSIAQPNVRNISGVTPETIGNLVRQAAQKPNVK
jgi:basic membrane lipoprotein Med (substrate-binding protein (PBP1-ABC) superfamily)